MVATTLGLEVWWQWPFAYQKQANAIAALAHKPDKGLFTVILSLYLSLFFSEKTGW